MFLTRMGSLDYIRVVEVYGPDIPFHYRFTIAQTIAEMGRGGRESPTALSLTPILYSNLLIFLSIFRNGYRFCLFFLSNG